MRLYENKMMLLIVSIILIIMGVLVIKYTHDAAITGNAVMETSVQVVPVPPKNCSFQLYSGWNLVSFYCLGMYTPTSKVLTSINNSYDAMFGYNDNDPADPWKSYNPNLPSWTVQQLSHMDRISGYWIYTGDNITFYYEGVYSSSVIPLSSGWNLIGYPKNSSTDVSTILGNISFNILKMYDTPNDTWYVYTNDSGNNTLQTFDAYKGYWIYASYDQSLNIVK